MVLMFLCLLSSASALASTRVVIATATEVNTLDPHMTTSVGSDLSVASHLYSSLVTRGPDLRLQPGLARRWQALSPTRWRFELVPGAHFADGEALDAATVQWNFQRILALGAKARIKPWFALVDQVRVIDAQTVEIDTREPFAALPAQLSMLFLLPPRWSATHDPATDSMPSGPYRIVENRPGDHLLLARNPQYWGPAPAFDEVELRIIPQDSSRVSALLAGEVDLITNIPLSEVQRIEGSGRAHAGAITSTRSVFIKLNTLHPPLDQASVRLALNYAIDKRGMVKALFNDQARVSDCQLLTPAYFGYNPALRPIAYDPDKARQLLREAGVKPGTRLQLEVPGNAYLQGDEVTQVVAAQLQEVGLDVQLVQFDFASWMNKYLKAHNLGDMALLTHAWPTIDADGLLSLLQGSSNYAYYQDPVFDADLAAGRATLDPAARQQAYAAATERLCSQAPVIFLYEQPFTYGISHRIRWHARGDDWLRAFDMSPAMERTDATP